MKGEGIYRPAFEMVERIQHEVIAAKADAQAALHWNKYYYVRYHGQLYRLQTDEYLAERNSQLIFEQSLIPELSMFTRLLLAIIRFNRKQSVYQQIY